MFQTAQSSEHLIHCYATYAYASSLILNVLCCRLLACEHFFCDTFSVGYLLTWGHQVGIHPGWDDMFIHTKASYNSQSTYWHVFGRLEQIREPRRNQHEMQNSKQTVTQAQDIYDTYFPYMKKWIYLKMNDIGCWGYCRMISKAIFICHLCWPQSSSAKLKRQGLCCKNALTHTLDFKIQDCHYHSVVIKCGTTQQSHKAHARNVHI